MLRDGWADEMRSYRSSSPGSGCFQTEFGNRPKRAFSGLVLAGAGKAEEVKVSENTDR